MNASSNEYPSSRKRQTLISESKLEFATKYSDTNWPMLYVSDEKLSSKLSKSIGYLEFGLILESVWAYFQYSQVLSSPTKSLNVAYRGVG
jgi:uncharacterized protein YukJ